MHSDNCLKTQKRIGSAQKEWDAAHPNACVKCYGTGGKTVYDTVDYGSTTAQLPSFEYCPNCIEQGLCPLCGANLTPNGTDAEIDAFNAWIETDEKCPQCRERFGEISRPEFDDCDCWNDYRSDPFDALQEYVLFPELDLEF